MTAQQYNEIVAECERKYKALLNVERVTGVNSMQSVAARAEWWGAMDIAKYIADRFIDQNAQSVFDIKKH